MKIQIKREEIVAKAKKEFLDAAKTARKPEMYKSDKDITEYLTTWDSYRAAMELSDQVAKTSFLTYLDGQWKKKLALFEEEVLGYTWEQFSNKFSKAILQVLGKPTSRLVLKHKLRNLRQKSTESVTDVYARMLELAADAFTEDETREMEAVKG